MLSCLLPMQFFSFEGFIFSELTNKNSCQKGDTDFLSIIYFASMFSSSSCAFNFSYTFRMNTNTKILCRQIYLPIS